MVAPVAVVIVDSPNHRVMHWICGASHGMILAGGNGPGSGLHQLKIPRGVAVDIDGAVMVADSQNNRVVRWTHGSDVGELVAGGNRGGNGLDQLQFARRAHGKNGLTNRLGRRGLSPRVAQHARC